MSLKNKPQTKEHKEKISKALKSHIMYKSLERSEKLRQANLGKVASIETRLKMSLARKGKKMPDWFGKYISETQSGKNSHNYGKKQLKETIEKRNNSRKGYKHSQETIEKISKANRKDFHKTDESTIWRKRVEYRLWRESVFSRDNWTCQCCKNIGLDLHPHHIRNFAEVVELRFAIDNGITLCVFCHRLFHKQNGKKNNTLIQINNFIKNNG